MTTEALLKALARLRVETGSLACLGCGYEHNCSTKGCRILRETADLIRQLSDENTELREEVNLRGNAVRTAKRKRAKAEAERDALREKVPQWVSVEYTERLPLPGTRVIATDGVFVGEAYRGKLGEWRRYDDCLCWFDVARQAVTHWVPLPEAPEAPKGGEKDA